MTAVVSVFGSSASRPGESTYQSAVRLGELLAAAGLTVANGGYGGVMEAVSEGARRRGGRVIGITAPSVFPQRPGPNLHLSEEHPAATITERIHQLVQIADATITMPGSLGTVTEFMVAWNVNFVAPWSGARHRLQIAVGPGWRRLIDLLAEEFSVDPGLVHCVDTVEEAADQVATHLGFPGPAGSPR